MNAPPIHAPSTVPDTRAALGADHKVGTVALDLVRAAAEYQALQQRHADVSPLVTEFSGRLGIEAPVVEALLAGEVKAQVQGDRLVVDLEHAPPVGGAATRHSRCGGMRHHYSADQQSVDAPDPNSRARRMQSVMLFHTASSSTREGAIGSQAQLCEFLCDLRHWCDEYMVDIHKALDQSYVRYMHDKHRGLASHVK